MFNNRLHERKILKKEKEFSKTEETYFTLDKMRINYTKHFKEDLGDSE